MTPPKTEPLQDDDCDGATDEGCVTTTTVESSSTTTVESSSTTTAASSTTTILSDSTTTTSQASTTSTIISTSCADNDGDGYGDNCSAGPYCNDNDFFYNEIGPDCTVRLIPQALGCFLGDKGNTRRLIVIGKKGTVFDDTTPVRWESSEIAVLSKRVFFKRFMCI